jgi:uncharacterized protein (TIGR03437 family)
MTVAAFLRQIGAVVAALVLAGSVRAQTTINFDNLNDGDVVAGQYPGATFSNAQIISAGFSLDELDYPTHSGQNAATDSAGPITLTLQSGAAGFSAYFTHSKPITVTAFDGSTKISSVASARNNTAVSGDGTAPNELLTVNGSNITKIVVTGDAAGNSLVMDDVTITPVPAGGGGGPPPFGNPLPAYPLSAMPASLTFDLLSGDPFTPFKYVFVTVSTPNTKISYSSDTGGTPWISLQLAGISESNLGIAVDPAGLKPGTYTGTVTLTSVQASNSPFAIPVTLNISVGALSATPASLAFNAAAGDPPSPLQQVLVKISKPNTKISYSVTTGGAAWIKVAPTGVSGSNLDIGVDPAGLTAGNYKGTITLTSPDASNSPLSIPVSLTITSPLDGPVIASFNSAASFASGALAGGSIATIFGTNLTTSTTSRSFPLSTNLGDVSVTINGIPAPLFYISPTQINLQIPYGVAQGPATLVLNGKGAQATSQIQIQATSPGIFLIGTYAAAINQDGATNGADHPVPVGNYVSIYMTGQGAVDSPAPDGIPTPDSPLAHVSAPVSALVGGQDATVLFAGLAPRLVGALQLILRVPDLPSGNYPVSVTIGGAVSNPALLAVVHP